MGPIIRTEHARRDAVAAGRQDLMTVKEYADYIGQHPGSVYRRIAAGTQRGLVRDGGSIRIDIVAARALEK